jgi:hypothetical protein
VNSLRIVRPLRSTAITAASSLLRDGPPPCPGPVLTLLRFLPLEELPPPRAFPRLDSRTTGSPVPCKSLNRARALFTPDAAGAVSRSSPRPIPGPRTSSWFRHHLKHFDASTRVRFHSPSRSAPDAVSAASFPRRSPPRLFTGAAHGGLLPPPARRQRRASLHLLHSTDSQQTAPTRPAGYRSGHTYAAAFVRNSHFILSSRFSRSSSRSRARSGMLSGGSSSACFSR